MAMAATKVWTLAEVDALPDDGNKHELVRGELIVTPAPGPPHESIASRLMVLLLPFVLQHRLGNVYLASSVVEHAGSRTQPDLQVRDEIRWDLPWERQPVPILVVEILSPSSPRAHQKLKRGFYEDVAVPEYWVVDPERRVITTVGSGIADSTTGNSLSWHPAHATEPLVIDVGRLFVSEWPELRRTRVQ